MFYNLVPVSSPLLFAKGLAVSYRKSLLFLLLNIVLLTLSLGLLAPGEPVQARNQHGSGQTQGLPTNSIRATTLDPADYLSGGKSAKKLAQELVKRFSKNNINLVYVNAYNVEYGAYYKTSYPLNTQSELGRQDFLKSFIKASHRKGIKVVAAFYDHQHRGAWEAHPDWREKRKDGGDYNPPRVDIVYFLSPSHPEFRKWWRGLIKDILANYPSLDGIELREPVINWWGTAADHNPYFTKAFKENYPQAKVGGKEWRLFRAQVLTNFLEDTISLIKAKGKEAHLTTVIDSLSDGSLASPEYLRDETGFDLEALLDSPHRPNVLKVELIWQQWAEVYDYVTFTPSWTKEATRQVLAQVRGRVPTVIHLELTDFGNHFLTTDEFFRTMGAALEGGAPGLDFYSAKLADEKGAWPALKALYSLGVTEGGGNLALKSAKKSLKVSPRALLLYDNPPLAEAGLSRIEALFLANLLGHFDLSWEIVPVEKYTTSYLNDFDYVFYKGSVFNNVPAHLLKDLSSYKGEVVWIGQNLWQFSQAYPQKDLGFSPPTKDAVTHFDKIVYKDKVLQDKGEIYPLKVINPSQVRVKATAQGKEEEVPYIIKVKNFWYVAGSPFSFPEEVHGRYLAFADVLHDIFKESHQENRQAILRIEDVHPNTSPAKLKKIADLLYEEEIPFLVGLIPFYVDPKKDVKVSLSDRPEFVRAIFYMMSKGGSVVLHGKSHQVEGKTGLDFEFWDESKNAPLSFDSEGFVRKRVEEALRESWANGIYPLAWETPHYAASGFDYALFGKYFDTFIERRTLGIFRDSDYKQVFPYQIKSDIYGGKIVPETLGFSPKEKPQIQEMAGRAQDLLVVRDGFAGGFLHPSLPLEQIKEYVREIKSLGYTFFDLKKTNPQVKTSDTVVLSGETRLQLVLQSGQYLNEFFLTEEGEIREKKYTRFPDYRRIDRKVKVPPGWIYVARVADPQELTLGHKLRQWGRDTSELVKPAGFFISWGLLFLSSLATFSLVVFYLTTKLRRIVL